MKNLKVKFLYFVKNNLLFFFSIPIIANSSLNFYHQNKTNLLDLFNFPRIVSFILGTLFFIYLSNFLNIKFLFGGRSTALTIYLTSYFIFDTIFMFLLKELSFKSTFIIVSFIWLIFIFLKTKNLFDIFKILFINSIYKIFNNFFINDLLINSNYQELNNDSPTQWYGLASMIYENNYYFAIENNLIKGQGLLSSYVQALLLEIGFSIKSFQFIQINSYLFLSFTILLISDLKISNKNKLISSILFATIVINNNWLEYLLLNSLMIEGIVSFLICVYLLNFLTMCKKKDSTSFLFFLSFGSMVYSKNFISLITLLVIIFFLFLKNNIYIIASFVIFGSNLLYQKIFFLKSQNFAYTSEINFKSILFDFLYLKNLEISNVTIILKQFSIDKPTTYLVIGFLIANIFGLIIFKFNFSTVELMLSVVILNYILINLLYVSYWKNIEIASSYRYILSCFHLIFISLVIRLSKFENI